MAQTYIVVISFTDPSGTARQAEVWVFAQDRAAAVAQVLESHSRLGHAVRVLQVWTWGSRI